MFQGRPIHSPWEMEFLGWPSGLTFEDFNWLVRDAPLRSAESERWLAVSALLTDWKQAGSNPSRVAELAFLRRVQLGNSDNVLRVHGE